jgi:peptidoglycan/xylan/chitin deacetylase (PgdA/CDA1 family)
LKNRVPDLKTILKSSMGRILRYALPHYFRSKTNSRMILMYHRVVNDLPKGLYDPALYVTAASFKMHIEELSRVFDIVPLDDLLKYDNSERLCAITFDDGWIDNYHVAFPILKERRIPATIFLPVNLVGSEHSFWFESLWQLANCIQKTKKEKAFVHYFNKLIREWSPPYLNTEAIMTLIGALKTKPSDTLDDLIEDSWHQLGLSSTGAQTVVDWEQVSEMGRHQITFGSHGSSHCILNTLSLDRKRQDIALSIQTLRKCSSAFVPWFSYPNGNWDADSIALLRDARYKGAVTTRLGNIDGQSEPYLLARIGLHEHISHTPGLLWFRLYQALRAQ